jgi:uncharacterized protein (UPF0335 family)
MNAEKLRAQIEREIDDLIAEIRGPDRAYLLSQGFDASEVAELMRLQDRRFKKWRDETVAELYAKTLRYAAAPDAPSHSVN